MSPEIKEKRVYLYRHGQAQHNLPQYTFEVAQSFPDPPLTPLGVTQTTSIPNAPIGRYLNSSKSSSILLLSSPLRRTIQTTLNGLTPLKEHIESLPKSNQKGVVLLPQAHESGPNPCDTGSPLSTLLDGEGFEFSSVKGLDWSEVEKVEPEWRSKQGFWSPHFDDLKKRAAWVRRYIRGRSEREVVLVAHNGILDFISRGEHREGVETWPNAEVRVFKFKEGDGSDDEWAFLERIPDETVLEELKLDVKL
ncbi:hypothetical protein BT69DRAFT_1355389 [Atractiella rhizophila]|nr:hypothetical protein BT69DRAFT_1355389 [Atractiella rhizophila]